MEISSVQGEKRRRMAMSRGKVETVSSLARWRPGRLDTLRPWTSWSDPFKMGIFEWSIGIVKLKDNGGVQFSVQLKPSPFLKEQSVVAKFMFRVFNIESGDSPYQSIVFTQKFETIGVFDPKVHTPTDSFVVDVEFFDLKISPASVGKQSPSLWPIEGMMGTMGYLATETILPGLSRMLKEGIHTDVVINTPKGTLRAHKAVLSTSSPVFESMFLHDLKEKETSTINIEDMTLESCTALLDCMYGAIKPEEFWSKRQVLLVAADKYGMTDLKNCCEDSLLMDVNSNNVLERLQEASIFRLDKLKKVCFKYLFGFGMIYRVRNDMGSFTQLADRELMLEMFQEMTTVQKPICK